MHPLRKLLKMRRAYLSYTNELLTRTCSTTAFAEAQEVAEVDRSAKNEDSKAMDGSSGARHRLLRIQVIFRLFLSTVGTV